MLLFIVFVVVCLHVASRFLQLVATRCCFYLSFVDLDCFLFLLGFGLCLVLCCILLLLFVGVASCVALWWFVVVFGVYMWWIVNAVTIHCY